MHLSVTVMHIHYCEAKNSLIQFQLTDFLLLFHFWLKDILKALFKLTNRLFAPLRQWVVTSNNKPTRCWALSLSPTAVSKSINITKIKPTFQQIQLQLRHVLLTGEFLFSKMVCQSSLPPDVRNHNAASDRLPASSTRYCHSNGMMLRLQRLTLKASWSGAGLSL